MRKETKDKLDKLQHFENRSLVVAIVSLTLLVGLYFAFRNVILSDQLKSGEVRWSVWKIHEKTGIRYPDIQAHLDDGQLVSTGTLEPAIPAAGARIVVREKKMITGYRQYSWEGTYDLKER
jgi:hypothetical protein